MTITKLQLKSIIKEEHELTVEKRRLRAIINEEYRNVLQEAVDATEIFGQLILNVKDGDTMQIYFSNKVCMKVVGWILVEGVPVKCNNDTS